VTRITDGPSKQVAVAVTNNNSVPSLINGLNTFSGGFILKHGGAIGTRVQIGSQIATIGPPGAVVSSPFGSGAITIGEAATDRAGFYVSQTNARIFNDVVFNTALGNDGPAAFRVDAGGFELAGTLTGNLAPVNLSGNGGNATVLLSGRVTGTQGLRLIRNSFATGNALSVTLRNLGATANDYGGPTTIENPHVLILGAAGQIPDGAGKGDVTVDGTLNLAGYSETINGLSGSGIVDSGWGFNPVVLTVGAGDGTGSFTGTLRNSAGTLGLVKVGAGTLSLSGTNTYVGGALELGAAGALGSTGPISFSGGALRYSAFDATDYSARFSTAAGQQVAVDTNAQSVTFASALSSVGGTLAKSGPGTLTLAAANTYSGDTTISSGTLAIGSGGTVGSVGPGSVDVASGATLAFNRSDDYGGAFTSTIFGGGDVRLAEGSLTLSGLNTYSGSTTVAGGTLRATNAQSLGQSFSSTALALTGGRLELAADSATIFGPFGLGMGTTISANTTIVSDRLTAGAGVAQELGSLAMGGETLTIARGANVTSGTATITFGAQATFSADPTIVTNTGAELVLAGGIGGGLTTLTKNGAGLLTLTGSGHGGGYAINAGTLRIGNGGTSGSLAAATGVTLASGALLAFDRTDNYGSAVSTPITGSGGLSLAAGTLALAGPNTFTGGTAVNGGRLIATLADVLGQGDVSIAAGGILQLDVTPLLGAGNAIATSPGGGLVYASGVSAPLEALSSLAGWQILPSASRLSTASMLYGTVPAGGTTLTASWLAGDVAQYSDILSLSGTGAGNPFVLSMAFDPATDSGLLEILNIGRRSGTSGAFAPIGTAFQGVGVPWTSTFVTPGQYGVDTVTSTVWVVSDTNSQFVVVPEPATLGLAAVAALAGLALLRRRG
jgi:autotransporter-associated beta strand protein